MITHFVIEKVKKARPDLVDDTQTLVNACLDLYGEYDEDADTWTPPDFRPRRHQGRTDRLAAWL